MAEKHGPENRKGARITGAPNQNSRTENGSALQFNPNHLKRLVAQIFREMLERRKVHDLPRLCLNVFGLPVRIREARMTVGHENSDERRVAMHHRLLPRTVPDAQHRTRSFSSSTE